MNDFEEAERELEKVEETLAMADRVIQISRQEQERLSSDLAAVMADPAESKDPVLSSPTI